MEYHKDILPTGSVNNMFLTIITLTICLLGFVPLTDAQDLLDTSGKYKLGLSLFAGGGTNNLDAGETTSGEDITISAGGGVGLALTAGYGLSSKFDIDVSAGIQRSSLSKEVSNAEGSFDRALLLATLMYKIPRSDTHQAKIGIGIGRYSSGELDVDGSDAPGGTHEVIEYDDAIGYHIVGVYEAIFPSGWAGSLALKYYAVTYDAKSAKQNGTSYPPGMLIDKVRELEGNGFDVIVSFSKYY